MSLELGAPLVKFALVWRNDNIQAEIRREKILKVEKEFGQASV